MSSVLPASATEQGRSPRQGHVWQLVIAGFAVMYLPLFWSALQKDGIWQDDDHAHGALILLVLLWLFWGLRRELASLDDKGAPALGWTVFLFGLLVYFAGTVFNITIFEFGSQPFVVAGILMLVKGIPAVRLAWFPILYFVFMIPLPGILVDTLTGPLKQWISAIVVELLYRVGYPISRTGVVISIGPYQMLVADACSGLHSMYSLSALGTLFMYIMARRNLVHNVSMLISILPIAFVANVVRVVALVLITYHLGDEAGQGFLHGAAGIVLMLVALAFFFALDALLGRVLLERRTASSPTADPPTQPS